jgi:hypothetical protein
MAPGTVSLVDVFRQSMVEAAKMSVGLGAERYYQFLKQFGWRQDRNGPRQWAAGTVGDGNGTG